MPINLDRVSIALVRRNDEKLLVTAKLTTRGRTCKLKSDKVRVRY
jgi:hypothetical protein